MELNVYQITLLRIGWYENLLFAVTVATSLVKFVMKPSLTFEGTVTNKSTLE
jgi:hypothetical protein